jgi:hypothetical protein
MMAPPSQGLEPPANPVRFKVLIANGKRNTIHAARRGRGMAQHDGLSVGQMQQIEKISHVIAVDLNLANR